MLFENVFENTNFKKNYFDFILCQGTILHANNDENCFKEIKRVLKPGGKFLVTVMGEGGLISDFVMKYLRPQYRQNKNVKKFINKIMYNKISGYKKFYLKKILLLTHIRAFIHDNLIAQITNIKSSGEKKQLDILKKVFTSFKAEVNEIDSKTKLILVYLPSHYEIINKKLYLRKEIINLTNDP